MQKKILSLLFISLLLFSVSSFTATAEKYPSYNYLQNGKITRTPQAFSVKNVLFSDDFSSESIEGAQDIFVDGDGTLYVSDTAHNRVLLRKKDGTCKKIEGFICQGKADTFNSPNGIFVYDNLLYVCDYGNNRLIKLSLSDNTAEIISNIQSDILDSDFVFRPKKVVADRYGRVYCVSDGQYNGLMVFEKDGSFSGFVGANKTTVSIADRIWRKLSTKAQQAGQSIFIPTEFESVAIDSDNFVYTVTSTVDRYAPEDSEPIRRQSPNGDNILSYNLTDYPIGDKIYSFDSETYSGPSRFLDIDVWGNGLYSALDQTRNRIFTYDANGSLLFIFGGVGENEGYFAEPKALSCSGGLIYVLDSKTGAVTLLEPTEYANRIINATDYTRDGDYNSALSAWSKVLDYNANNELAYLNISRILLNRNDYKGAMEYAVKANNQAVYSEAFIQARTAIIGKNIGLIVFAFAFVVTAVMLLGKLIKRKRIAERLCKRSATVAALSYDRHILYAPFDGFWVQKREKKGNILSGVIILFFLFLSFVLSAEFTGFCFSLPADELSRFNIFKELAKTVLPIMLWCISNWCITTLIGGSGTFKDIFISSSTALIPYISASLLKTVLSHCLSLNEGAVLNIIMAIGIAYSAFLLIAAICSIHECTMGKACITILLTVIGMIVIVFIAILFFNLINKFFDFIISFYNEIRLRL